MAIELGNLNVGATGVTSTNQWIEYPYVTPVSYPVYYPIYSVVDRNKTEIAFKILQVLVEKEKIKATTVEEFISLVNEISKQL